MFLVLFCSTNVATLDGQAAELLLYRLLSIPLVEQVTFEEHSTLKHIVQ